MGGWVSVCTAVNPRWMEASSGFVSANTTAAAASPQPQGRQSISTSGGANRVVVNSPYGTQPQRNGVYGWGSLFQAPRSAVIAHLPNIRVGISSLNGVSGTRDRRMSTLLQQYRRKFSCLEHCYPYHRVSEASAWQSWADMVQDSNRSPTNEQCVTTSNGGESVRVACGDEGGGLKRRVQPSRFLYTVKANKYLTHEKLATLDADLEAHVDLFFTQRCPLLEPFMGPVLLQFPPAFGYSRANLQKLESLAERLPQETVDYLTTDPVTGEEREVSHRQIRIAVEFRHRSWSNAEAFALLRRLGWALVVAHHHDDATYATHVDTGVNFMYVRLHGPLGKYVGDYGPERLRLWAEQIVRFVKRSPSSDDVSRDKEVYVFLNNSDSHVGGTTSSTVDATCLAEAIANLLPPPPPLERSASGTPASTPADRTSQQTQGGRASHQSSKGSPHQSPKRPREDDGSRSSIREEAARCILDVDRASSDTVVID